MNSNWQDGPLIAMTSGPSKKGKFGHRGTYIERGHVKIEGYATTRQETTSSYLFQAFL